MTCPYLTIDSFLVRFLAYNASQELHTLSLTTSADTRCCSFSLKLVQKKPKTNIFSLLGKLFPKLRTFFESQDFWDIFWIGELVSFVGWFLGLFQIARSFGISFETFENFWSLEGFWYYKIFWNFGIFADYWEFLRKYK